MTAATTAFVFPGQGSQSVGMGRDLAHGSPVAKAVFVEVDAAIKDDLSSVMFGGPAETLTLTENAQPAIMAVSIAVTRTLMLESGKTLRDLCSVTAGHSLGEYSALAAAGAISLWDAARLLRLRGRSMQKAVPVGEGAMAVLLGVDIATARAVATAAAEAAGADAVCEAANDNTPEQVVVSGSRAAVEKAVDLAPDHGAKRAMLLPVSAPFHCSLMRPAAETMARALADLRITPPEVPVVCNFTAEPTQDPEAIRRLLVDQVTGLVRWRESMVAVAEAGVDRLVELGHGKVLSGMARRIDKRLSATALQGLDDIRAFARPPGA